MFRRQHEKLLQDKYGEIEEMNVCDNLGDHLVGNVYIKFKYELDAESVSSVPQLVGTTQWVLTLL